MIDHFVAAKERFTPVALVEISDERASEESHRRGWDHGPVEVSGFGSLEMAVYQVEADACIINSPERLDLPPIP
jgi:hypothetical protein